MTKKRDGAQMGRPCVFRNKTGGARVHGVITKIGATKFELARTRLARLAPHVKHPSDADVIEYLTIGEEATRVYIADHADD